MSKTYYQEKDAIKFSVCNKLISRGTYGSSSDKYSKEGFKNIPLEKINIKEYLPTDIVGISVNGKRKNRIEFDKELLLLAINAKASIVKDNDYASSRDFNIGERNVSKFLEENNYHMVINDKFRSVWKPIK